MMKRERRRERGWEGRKKGEEWNRAKRRRWEEREGRRGEGIY